MDPTFHFLILTHVGLPGLTVTSNARCHAHPIKALNCKSVQSYTAGDARYEHGLKAWPDVKEDGMIRECLEGIMKTRNHHNTLHDVKKNIIAG